MHYQYNQKPNTVFSEEAVQILNMISQRQYSVLIGRNNCGKSYILKTLAKKTGPQSSYIGPARYQNFNILGLYTPNSNRKGEKWKQLIQQISNEQHNFDNSPLNLQIAIAQLSDQQRSVLFSIIDKILGVKLTILHTIESNSMSQKYINCDNHNLSFTSSGFRLIMTLLTCLLDTDYDTFLIDEPELGISPEAQGILADFIFNREYRDLYFPHIKHLVLATHSTIFLDRQDIHNNYSVTKQEDMININETLTINDFNNIHFFLLGNRLENLYLPTCIILTEGKCDHAYLSKVLKTKFPNLQFSVMCSNGDSRMKEIISLAGNIFTDLQKSPYRTRIFAVLDKVHGTDVVETLKRAGLPDENIIIWSQNGIEYFYPEKIVDLIFGGQGGPLDINGDIISRNGITYKKWDLCEKVISLMNENTEFPSEISETLFKKISQLQ